MLKQSCGHAPEYHYLPPVVNSSISFPIQIMREKLNCACGNTINLLTYINHFNTGLKQKLLILRAKSKVCDQKDPMCLHHCGYDIIVIPSILSYSCLQTVLTELRIPMLVSLELNFCSVPHEHVIGISPIISSDMGQV